MFEEVVIEVEDSASSTGFARIGKVKFDSHSPALRAAAIAEAKREIERWHSSDQFVGKSLRARIGNVTVVGSYLTA